MTNSQIPTHALRRTRLHKLVMVHAQGRKGATATILAGCDSIDHGNRLTDAVLDLIPSHTYFDPSFRLLIHNYLENKNKYCERDNFNEARVQVLADGSRSASTRSSGR